MSRIQNFVADKEMRVVMFTTLCQFQKLFIILHGRHYVSADYESLVKSLTSTSDACAREVELDMAQALAS